MDISTAHEIFGLLSQATTNGATNVNTLLLANHGAGALAAAKPYSQILRMPPGVGSAATVRFALRHATAADNTVALANLWLWHGDGPGMLLASLTVTAGAAVIPAAEIGRYRATAGTGQWCWADTIAVTEDNTDPISSGLRVRGKSGGDGVMELSFDLKGAFELFCDFDCDISAGAACTDALALVKWW